MQFIYDHLIATIVGGILILLLIVVQLRATETNVEAVGFYDAKVKQIMFGEVIQTDIANIGAGRAATETMIESWSASSFDFWTQTDSSGTVERVRYDLVQDGTQTVGDSTYTLYRIDRFRNGTRDGGSASYVTSFQISLFDDGGTPVTSADFDRARRVAIRIESLSPWQGPVEQSVWRYSVRPTNLARKVN